MLHTRFCFAIACAALLTVSSTGLAEPISPSNNGYSVLMTPPATKMPTPAAMDLWQEPASCVACAADACDGCGGCDACGGCDSWCAPCWYGQTDLLIWWVKGNKVLPLVTTSDQSDGGVLGQPTTQVLHGGGSVDGNYRVGVRVQLGRWLDDCATTGMEVTWISLGDGANTGNYHAQSDGNTLLARPFFSLLGNQQDASLVAAQGLLSGMIDVRTSSELHTMALSLRHNLWQSCGDRVDVVGGYRYFRYREGLTVEENRVVTEVGGPVAVGTAINVFDQFATENDFHGAELGISAAACRGSWNFDMLAKIAIGNMHQRARIYGMNSVMSPNQTPSTSAGGLLALSTNIGDYTSNNFGFLPELNLNARYCWSERVSFVMGYSLLWATNVMRTGDQIDPVVNVSQLPANGNNLIGPARPAPVLGDTAMWIQGLNFGVSWDY